TITFVRRNGCRGVFAHTWLHQSLLMGRKRACSLPQPTTPRSANLVAVLALPAKLIKKSYFLNQFGNAHGGGSVTALQPSPGSPTYTSAVNRTVPENAKVSCYRLRGQAAANVPRI